MRLMGNLRAPLVCSFCLLSVACSASSEGDSPTLDTGAGGAGGSGEVKAAGGATGLGAASGAGGSVSGAAGKASNAGSADAGSGSGGSDATGGAGSGRMSGAVNEGGVTSTAERPDCARARARSLEGRSPSRLRGNRWPRSVHAGSRARPQQRMCSLRVHPELQRRDWYRPLQDDRRGFDLEKDRPTRRADECPIDPKDSQHLYAVDGVRGGTMGFWISKDGGATWSVPSSWGAIGKDFNYGDLYDIAVEPGDFNHLLVTSHSWWGDKYPTGSGILESHDGGASWTIHPPTGTWGSGHSIWFLGDSRTWLLGTQDAGFWRTSDSGASWTQVVKDEGIMHGGGRIPG